MRKISFWEILLGALGIKLESFGVKGCCTQRIYVLLLVGDSETVP